MSLIGRITCGKGATHLPRLVRHTAWVFFLTAA